MVLPKLMHAAMPPGTAALASAAAVLQGITALLGTVFLMRCFGRHEAGH